VLGVEEATAQNLLMNCELFLFTDNSVAEAAFHKGTSSSKVLFHLILCLQLLQFHKELHLHVIHIAGTCMQLQGTDGLSRGLLDAGVLVGNNMLSYIPIHLSAVARSSTVQAWVNSWTGHETFSLLQAYDWFNNGQQAGHWLWCPPPAAANVALEQLAAAVHKRPHTLHIVLIPRLMMASWRKLLGKICDLVFTVPLGTTMWPTDFFEPLVVGIYFPLLRYRPWQLRGTALLDNVESALSSLPRDAVYWGGDILHELFRQARTLGSMSPSVAWEMLSGN
jgi:hypothetical protein